MKSSRRLNSVVNHITHSHGKEGVRIVKVFRDNDAGMHEVKEFNVSTVLLGPVDDAFRKGDNSCIVATDTQKNTIYVLGKRHAFRSAEEFAMIIAKHFVKTYPKYVHTCRVSILEVIWQRLEVPCSKGKADSPHHHAFQKIGPHQGYTFAEATNDSGNIIVSALHSGLRQWTLLKTTQSSFANFVRDQYTLLPDAADRLLGTAVDTTWNYGAEFIKSTTDWEAVKKTVKQELLYEFSGPADIGVFSNSVQETAYNMGCKALQAVEGITSIKLFLPNIHNIPVDFTKLGMENKDHTGHPDVFVATGEPRGTIEVTINREEIEGKPTNNASTPISSTTRPNSGKSQITTHVLDTSLGSPAKGIRCTLQKPADNGWATIASGITNQDGRVSNLLAGNELLTPGRYRMHFEIGPYYKAKNIKTFYPEAFVVFETFDTNHYHVPLLLNPFGYSTYRGS